MIFLWMWLLLGATYPSPVTHVVPGGMLEKTSVRSVPPTTTEPSENLKSERVQDS